MAEAGKGSSQKAAPRSGGEPASSHPTGKGKAEVASGHAGARPPRNAGARQDGAARPAPPPEWAGPLLGRDAVAARLGIERRTLDAWRRGGRVLAFLGDDGFVYPAAQFGNKGKQRGITHVLAKVSKRSDVAWKWLLTPSRACGGATPLDQLEAGAVDKVIDAAEQEFV